MVRSFRAVVDVAKSSQASRGLAAALEEAGDTEALGASGGAGFSQGLDSASSVAPGGGGVTADGGDEAEAEALLKNFSQMSSQ